MADEEESAEADDVEESGGKKGSKKKLILMVVLLVLIGYVAATKTVLKPPPKTAAQLQAEKEEATFSLRLECAIANDRPLPAPPAPQAGMAPITTTSIPEDTEPIGPVLAIESTTLNLAGGHFLKIGVALQLPVGVVGAEGKVEELAQHENWSVMTSQVVLNAFANKPMDEILPNEKREELRHEIGYEVCLRSEGKASTVYFTEFVTQ